MLSAKHRAAHCNELFMGDITDNNKQNEVKLLEKATRKTQ